MALYLSYRPENAYELFNLRHASLRNVIERIFGVVKRKFKILGQVPEYSVDTQVHLVLALCGLYNFIRQYEDIDDELEEVELEDEGAQQMWKDYQEYLSRE
jgi:DDE superfamily endonuclease